MSDDYLTFKMNDNVIDLNTDEENDRKFDFLISA